MTYVRTGTGLTITYQGTLESADSLSGPWSNVTGATSPYVVTPGSPQKFFRAKN
jgi:hypothetical protein